MLNQQTAAIEPEADFLTEEMDAGPPVEDHPMALLLEEFDDSYVNQPQTGDIRHGVVVDKRAGELLIDIGYKSEGIVTGREVDRLEGDFKDMSIGDELPVYVMREDRDGNLLLSISRARAESDWKLAEELLESQDMFTGSVSGFNRGGVIVKIGQVRGFVPASQLSSESQSRQLTEGEPDNRWMKLMDAELRMKVIDLDRRRNRLILSESVAIREWRREQKEKLPRDARRKLRLRRCRQQPRRLRRIRQPRRCRRPHPSKRTELGPHQPSQGSRLHRRKN